MWIGSEAAKSASVCCAAAGAEIAMAKERKQSSHGAGLATLWGIIGRADDLEPGQRAAVGARDAGVARARRLP